MKTFAQIGQVSLMLGDGWAFIDRNAPGEKVYLWRGSEQAVVNAAGQVRATAHLKRVKVPKRIKTKLQKPRLNAKLSIAAVREIRSRRGEKQTALAVEFGVGEPAISCIMRGKTWAHVA